MEEIEKIATLTGRAFQDDETFKSEGGFEPERDQYYFEMKQDDSIFFVGVRDIIRCIRLLEKMKEIPEINGQWWQKIATLYGEEILLSEYKEL